MYELDVMDIDYYPSIEEIKNKEDYIKFPKAELSALGMIGSMFIKQTGTVTTTLNMDGIYSVTLPKGLHLANFKDGSGISAMAYDKGNHLKAQARLHKLGGITAEQTYTAPLDPAIACMALMLLCIDKKLDTIQETQKDILSVIKTKEHGDIKGNIQYLYDILANLKNHYSDEQYKKEYRLKAQDIIQDSYKYIETYKERLKDGISKNNGLLHTTIQANKEITSLVEDFAYYRLSIFMFAYAHYVELLLGNTIDENLVQSELQRLNNLSMDYRKMYTDLYNYLDTLNHTSLDKKAIDVLGNASQGLGHMIHKVPLLEKGPVDEALVSLGKNVKKQAKNSLVNSLEYLRNYKQLNVDGFVKQYEKLGYMYSGEATLLFDKNNVYVSRKLIN